MACSICSHPKAADIAAALRTTGPHPVARTFGVSKTSLLRHRDKCLGGIRPEQPPPVTVAPALSRAPSWDGKAHAGQPCATCRSPVRAEIERRMLDGAPCAAIARELEGAPSHDSMRHHQRKCIGDRFRMARAEIQGAEVMSVLADLETLRDKAMGLLNAATACAEGAQKKLEGEPDGAGATADDAKARAAAHRGLMSALRTAGELVGKAKGVLELVAKVTGELRTTVVLDIQKAPEWPAFVVAISDAVADCDGCSKAVETAVQGVKAAA